MTTPSPTVPTAKRRRGVLDLIEWIGNKLPDPAMIFLIGGLIVIGVSAWGAAAGWSVEELRPVRTAGSEALTLEPTGVSLTVQNLASSDGLYWIMANLIPNFIKFPPLGIVLVGMLGIGVAERTGLIGAALKAMMLITPAKLLTPSIVFLGVISSVGSDAGYIILPPLAAALYQSVGRSPLVGIAAAFAGVSGGFSAGLFISGGDAVMAGLSTSAAQIIDPEYEVLATANWWFMIASTFVLTLAGWATTSLFVERRMRGRAPEDGGPSPAMAADLSDKGLSSDEKRGLALAFVGTLLASALTLALVLIPGWPLYGRVPSGSSSALRWTQVVVPLIFFLFIVPGILFGVATRVVTGASSVVKLMVESMKAMAPIIVLAFFAAQFIEWFAFSNLGKMLAMWGGGALATADLSTGVLMIVFVVISAFFNLFISSMSAKYAILAPIFVPMFMLVGVSPELTQMAYRVGDSTTNIITPMNAYMVIILVVMQRFAPKAGMGTMMAMMLPYTFVFLLVWSALLMVWIAGGWELGLGGPLEYVPSGAMSAPAAQ